MTGSQSVQNQDEPGLILLASRGDRHAFGELVCRYREGMVNVVYRMCGDAALAEEAAQEAFLKAWQNLMRYDPRFAFRSWIYRIAINTALDALRRERPSVDIDAMAIPEPSDGPEASYEVKERAARVRQAVLELPVGSRMVLVLREYEGLSYREIADALDVPLGTVMSRLSYARRHLREVLQVDLEVP